MEFNLISYSLFYFQSQDYLHEVQKWYSILMPKMQPYLYGRGGNIILVQVENEYGSTSGCDFKYTHWLRDVTQYYVNNDALLYTTDGTYDGMVQCGHVNGTVQSVDFGAVNGDIHKQFEALRKYYPHGPLINSEFYAGWLSHWQEEFPDVSAHSVAKTLDSMLKAGVNVNFYMFFGGTNFGFTSGANTDPNFNPQTTSYDYDAPLNEAGDVTEKYWVIRNVTAKYVELKGEVPANTRKLTLPEIHMNMSASFFNPAVRAEVCRETRTGMDPLTFEDFNQKGGLMFYETNLPDNLKKDPVILSVKEIQDRALVYIDRSYVGLLDRQTSLMSVAFSPNNGNKLQLIVEDQGRVNYGTLDTWKGVKLVTIGGKVIQRWISSACPLTDGNHLTHLVRNFAMPRRRGLPAMIRGPTFFIGEFSLEPEKVLDTFLDLSGWSKGVAYVNGVNLGRYWSSVKPQRTLYVPKEYLKSGRNEIILFEYQSASINRTVKFVDHPLLRATDDQLYGGI